MKKFKKILAALLTASLSFGVFNYIPSFAVTNHVSAVRIEVNQDKIDNLTSTVTNKDYYIELPADGFISISFTHENAEQTYSTWKVILENEDGKCFFEQNYIGNATETKESVKYGLGKGKYYIRVSDHVRNSNKKYTLKVNYTPKKGWETEINDTKEAATEIDYNSPVNGNLYDLHDTDFYKVELPASGFINLTFQHDKVEGDEGAQKFWAASIFDSEGKVLSKEDIYESYAGNVADPVTGGNIGVAAGVYYVQIKNLTASSILNYNLQLNYTVSNSWEKESNDSMETANAFSVGNEMNGKLEYKDYDYYKVTTTGTMGVKLSFSHAPVSSAGSYLITAFDEQEKPIITKQISEFNRSDVLTVNFELPEGTTYFCVSSSELDKAVSALEYKLSVAPLNCEWIVIDKKSYWYEGGVRQGTYNDANGVLGKGTVRGREIFDPVSNGWYWLDSVYYGAKACNKEVWMPYIYQKESTYNDTKMRQLANASSSMADYVYNCMKNHTGKWVRYDADGKMIKGWFTVDTEELKKLYPKQYGNTYYYDPLTGIMAKGYVTIDNVTHYFDENTGVCVY